MLNSNKINKFKGILCKTFLMDRQAFKRYIENGFNDKEFIEFLNELGLDEKKLVFQEQKHTDNMKVVDKSSFKERNVILNNDAMISGEKDLYLCAYTADCVPVMFFDSESKSIGIAHAGWKGVLKLIAQKTAKKLNEFFEVEYSNLKCYLGPSINDCCYEVSRAEDERVKYFIKQFGNNIVRREKNKIYLNMQKAITLQLEDLGVLKDNIEISPHCTYCSENSNLPSYYREGKNYKKSFLSVIGIEK